MSEADKLFKKLGYEKRGIKMDIEEDIKILNEYINIDRKMRNNNQESDYEKFCERQCIAIEHVLAEREEDKKRIEELEVLEDDLKNKRIAYVDTPEFEENYIPKQKVKEEIEALRKMFKATMEGKLQEYTPGEIIIKRNTLKELLEE